MFPTSLDVGSGTLPTHREEVPRTRFRPARWTPTLLVTMAVLLGACSAESPDPGSATAGSSKSATPTESGEPEKPGGRFDPTDPDEPTLPGGVKVLSRDVAGFVPVDAGRYAVRVSDSLLYQFDLPAYSDVHSGVYLNPGRRSDVDSIVWLTPANKRTALPVHPCRNHDPKVVGPTVGNLASALNRQPYLATTKPVAVTVGGMDGLFVKMSVPDNANVSTCQEESVDIMTRDTQSVEDPGTVDRIWILDVDGVRHVLRARTFGASKRDARLVTQLVKSITFTQD